MKNKRLTAASSYKDDMKICWKPKNIIVSSMEDLQHGIMVIWETTSSLGS
jgi:hypothetical protein